MNKYSVKDSTKLKQNNGYKIYKLTTSPILIFAKMLIQRMLMGGTGGRVAVLLTLIRLYLHLLEIFTAFFM